MPFLRTTQNEFKLKNATLKQIVDDILKREARDHCDRP